MNHTTPASSTPEQGLLFSPAQNIDAVQQQLFQYAQDLQDLMGQQSKLQQRHQQVLQFMGRGEESDDLLLNTILKTIDLYLVTDGQGEIMHASPGADKALSTPGRTLNWLPIQQLMPPEQRADINELLDSLSAVGASHAIHRRRVTLSDHTAPDGTAVYEAMVLRVGKSEQAEIYWLLGHKVQAGASETELQQAFSLLGEGTEALMITHPNGEMCAINPAFSRIMGYSEPEVIGQNPHLLSSGLQDADFYKTFWTHLRDDGGWSGEFFNRRKNGQLIFAWTTIKVVKNVQGETVGYLAVFTDMSHREDDGGQVALLVYHDPLTGLPNRRLFDDRLAQAMADVNREPGSLYVLCLSLDRFRSITDDLGHDVGDLILQQCSARLKTWMRPGDTVARVGGDEFVVLLRNVDGEADAKNIADSLQNVLSEQILASQHQVSITASMGCALCGREDDDIDTLIKHAENAMFRAKRRGANFAFYEARAV